MNKRKVQLMVAAVAASAMLFGVAGPAAAQGVQPVVEESADVVDESGDVVGATEDFVNAEVSTVESTGADLLTGVASALE